MRSMQRAFDAISVQKDTKYVECAPTHIFGRAFDAIHGVAATRQLHHSLHRDRGGSNWPRRTLRAARTS